MEALAVIGLVSSIVQFVDFGSKIVSRLNEYRKAGNDVPKTFQRISVDLPLIIDSLKRTKQQADAQEINDETAKVLLPVVEACLAKVKELERVLNKTLPVEGDSTWRSSKKALISVANEKAVKDVMGDLKDHLQTLVHSQILSGPSPSSQIATYRELLSLHSNTCSGHQPRFMVKYTRERNFVGREDILKEIDRRFSDQQPCVAISGVGGVGYRQTHPKAHVFWVHASSRARFTVAYYKIGEELGLSDLNNPEVDTTELVQKWLSRDASGPWLLVLDNADDLETFFGSANDGQSTTMLFNYLPQSTVSSILVTTRDKRIGHRMAPFEMPITVLPFDMNNAKNLLQKTLLEDDLNSENSAALLEALDFLPIAISQAAAFIRENSISLSEYLGYLQAGDNEVKDLLGESYHCAGRDPESQNSVLQTWKISFECIRKQTPRAVEILALMAVLDRQAIQKHLLRKNKERDLDFATAVGTLKAFYLITEESVEGTFSMHRLVQLSMQRWLELEGAIEGWQKKAIHVISSLCTADYNFIGDWKSWHSINPHAHVVLSFVFQNDLFVLERAKILHRLAIHELEEGTITNAKLKAQEAFSIAQALDEGHPRRVTIARTMAGVLCHLGEFAEAELIHRQSLDQVRAKFGPNHPETILCLDCIADTLSKQGKYEEAESLQRQVVMAWTTSPDLASNRFRFSCFTGLAYSLEMQCKFEEAKEMAQKAIDGHTEEFGAQHPFTTHNLRVLSSILMKQGKLEAAEAVARKALDNYECSLGPQHSYTLWCRAFTAQILKKQAKFEAAERIIRPAYDELVILVGPHHEDTIHALCDLISTLLKQSKYQEAESLLQKAGFDWGERSGHASLSKACAMTFLVHIRERQGKWEEAEQLGRQAVSDFESLFGPRHEETLNALTSLARVLGKQNKYEEAELVARQVVQSYEDKLGPDDQLTLDASLSLSHILGGLKKYKEAEAISLRAFQASKISLGLSHSVTAVCLSHLAFAQVAQGKHETVIEMCKPLLDTYLDELGPEHPVLPPLFHWVADALINLRRYEEAELLCQQAADGYEATMGPEDSYTLSALTTLAFSLEHQGKFDAAEPLRKRVLDSREKVLGPEHVDTIETAYALARILHSRMQYEQASVLYQRVQAGSEKAFGPGHPLTAQCTEDLAILKSNIESQNRLSHRFFPRGRTLLTKLGHSKMAHRRHTTEFSG